MKKSTAVEAIVSGLRAVTKDWARQRKAEERHTSRVAARYRVLVRARETTIKEAAYQVMEQAYLKASANGTLPANARQIMYAARPLIQDITDKRLDDQYFTQQLLPDYMQERGVEWDVVFDDRGHFSEPHTKRTIGLGTLAVQNYLAQLAPPQFEEASFATATIDTSGPECRFGAVLFIEKEGFMPLLEHAQIGKRYDLAIMSTKGISNTAARQLIDDMCGLHRIPLLVLHDFDKAGFSIIGTLRQSNRRYQFRHKIRVIDLGLRLTDIEGLEAEDVYDRGSLEAIRANLHANGATKEEIEFLLHRRVELNAMASDELIAFIESKLAACGIKKVVPTKQLLADAYRLFVRSSRIEKVVQAALEPEEETAIKVPTDLAAQVGNYLTAHPEAQWDDAVREIAARNNE